MGNNVPYLCGGILFDLLLQARKNRTKARNKLGGGSDGLSDTDMLKGLIYVVTGEKVKVLGNSFAKATSQYKTCEISGNTYIPFKDNSIINSFDTAVKKGSFDTQNRMVDFIREFLNPKKYEWLIRALLEIIKTDESIPNNYEFEDCGTHRFTKESYDSIEFVNIDEFLLSVLHFVITQRPNNENGKNTFESWFYRSSSHAEWKFDSTIGSNCLIEFLVMTNDDYGRISEKTKHNDFMYLEQEKKQYIYNPIDNITKTEEQQFSKYLKKAKGFYSQIKTLLYTEKPYNFYDFHVCNTLELIDNDARRQLAMMDKHDSMVINGVTASILKDTSNFVIIAGTGGIGKSMMLRHLLLQSIDAFEKTHMLPILVPLKNYNSDCDLRDFIYQTVRAIDGNINKELLFGLLEMGNCVLLLDGLDEVNSALRDRFEIELQHLTVKYPENTYVVSSRPVSKFLSYQRFTVLKINEFTKDQALELIDKLKYHDPEAKAKFRADLDKHLFYSHKQFASNPLLLTIMLMTYSSIGDIPRKMHIFYRKAFETMARLHDATKGAYKRPLHTKLEPEEFAEYFAEFCARTYKLEVLEFTSISFCTYMDKVIKHRNNEHNFTAWDFLLDLKDNLCVMYEEGEKYYFVHRSFQEYFTADFYSKQMDDKLPQIAKQFVELRQKSYHDKTFDMLYDMIPQKIDRFVFVPYLKELWNKCDEAKGYWTFLDTMYPVIYSYMGDVEEWTENSPEDYFYDFIVNENLIRYNGQLDDLDWPSSADRFKEEYARIPIDETVGGKTKTVMTVMPTNTWRFDELLKTFPDDYEVDYCGAKWEIDVAEILKEKTKYKSLMEFMERDEFPLKKEYTQLRAYSQKLFTQYERKQNEDDFDDWFDTLS